MLSCFQILQPLWSHAPLLPWVRARELVNLKGLDKRDSLCWLTKYDRCIQLWAAYRSGSKIALPTHLLAVIQNVLNPHCL